MNLNYAAYLMNEDVQLLCEDADSEGKKKAKKWIIDNWELCYGKNFNFGTDDENRIKEIKAEKSEELFQIVDGLYNHPMDHTHGYPDQGTAVLRGIVDGRPDWEVPPRYDSRGSKVFTPAIVRLLITELGFNSHRVDKARIRTLHKIILVAYMQWRADNSKWNRDLNGKSYRQLFNELSPYFDEAREWFKNLADTWQRNNADHPERARMIINRARGINEPDQEDTDNNALSDTSHDIDDGLPQPDLSHAFRIGSYNAVYIPNHQAATYWNKYTNHTSDYAGCNWCITMRSPGNWNAYYCGEDRTVYFLFKDNFKALNITDFNNDMSSQPNNEYGRSLLCVMIERYCGEWSFLQMTSRYNHCDGRGNIHDNGRWGDYFVEKDNASAAARVIGCTVEEMKEKLPWRMPGSVDENTTAGLDWRILNNSLHPSKSVTIDNKKIDLYVYNDLYKIAVDGVDILHKWFKYCSILPNSKYAYISEDNDTYPTNLVTFDGEYLLPHDVKRIARIFGMNEGYLICSKVSNSSTQYNIFNAITHQYLFKKDKTLNFELDSGSLTFPVAVYIDGKFSIKDSDAEIHIITKQGEEITPELNDGDELKAGVLIYNQNDNQLFTLGHKLICTFPSDKHVKYIDHDVDNGTTNIMGIECIDVDNDTKYYMVYNRKKNKLASPTLYKTLSVVNKNRIILLRKFDSKYDIMFEDGTMIDSNVEDYYCSNLEVHNGLILKKDGKYKYVNLNTGKIIKETTRFNEADERILNTSFADDAVIIRKNNNIILRSLDNKFSDKSLQVLTDTETMKVDQSFTINSRTGKFYCINLTKYDDTRNTKAFIIKDNGQIIQTLSNVAKIDDDIVLVRAANVDSDTDYSYYLIDYYTGRASASIREFVSWFDDHGIAEVKIVGRGNNSYFINLDLDMATSIDELDESVEITKKPNTLLEAASYLLI